MTGSHPDGPRKLRSASKSRSTQEETPNTTATENTPVGDDDNGLMTPKQTTGTVEFSTPSITIKVKNKYCGSSCNTLISETDDFLNCEKCKNDFHLKCTLFDPEVFALLKTKDSFGDVLWRCSTCKTETNGDSTNSLLLIINELRSRIESIQKQMENLIGSSAGKLEVVQPSKPIAQQNTFTKHTILVKSNDSEDNSFSEKSWSSIVKKSIEPNLRNIPVNRSIRTKNGKGVIFFPSAESRNLAASKLQNLCTIELQDKSNKVLYPKIKISEIPTDYLGEQEKQNIKSAILEKNPAIEDLVSKEGKLLEVLFVQKENHGNGSYAVVKVDDTIRKAVMSQGRKIYMGLSSCRVSDRYHLVQCYCCQEFGHKIGSDKCRFKGSGEAICLYCAGSHSSKSCPNKKKKETFNCHNCATSKNNNTKNNSHGHTTTSFDCPIFQQALKATMNRTMGTEYRTNISKNEICT